MAEIPDRRGPVIGFSLLAWLVLLALLAAASRGRLARQGVRMAGLAVVYLPLVLLLGAALEPGQGVEQLLVLFGAPLLAAATLATLAGYRALAVAAALTVVAYAIDVVAGSPLTSLSLLGPNPGLGVRFYGIGNELEALLAVLVVAGTGAALTGFAPRASSRAQVTAFLATGLVSAFVFAAGRFGADVGAAIVLPLGAAVAAATLGGRRRRALLLAVAAPVAAVALLALVDLVSGANAHLTRSVLDAGGLDEIAEVAQRRLQLSAHSFARPIVYVFLPLLAVVGGARVRLAGSHRVLAGGPPGHARRPRRRPGGDPAGNPGERLRRPPARDRHRLSARLHRLRLGRDGRLTRPLPLVLRAHRACLAIFLVLSGRREPARRGACRGVPRPRPPRACARTLRPARPPQPGCRTAPRRKRASRPTT